MSLHQIMTAKEALCFRAVQRWQRVHLMQQFKKAATPTPLFLNAFQRSSDFCKLLLLILLVITCPLWLAWWLVVLVYTLIHLPFRLLATVLKPFGLRAPGERNIKGLHYQFSAYIDLPPTLYIHCVDEWVSILYGPQKLPEFSLQRYLDADYLLHRNMGFNDDEALRGLILTQISNAREELSRDLGHY